MIAVTRHEALLMVDAYRHAMTGTGREIRVSHGLTLLAVANAIGVTEGGLSRWETGRRRPTGKRALEWARFLSDLERVAA